MLFIEYSSPVLSHSKTRGILFLEYSSPLLSLSKTRGILFLEYSSPLLSLSKTRGILFLEYTSPLLSLSKTRGILFMEYSSNPSCPETPLFLMSLILCLTSYFVFPVLDLCLCHNAVKQTNICITITYHTRMRSLAGNAQHMKDNYSNL